MSNEFHDENNLYHFNYRDPNAGSHAESAAGSIVEPAADPVVTNTPAQNGFGAANKLVNFLMAALAVWARRCSAITRKITGKGISPASAKGRCSHLY